MSFAEWYRNWFDYDVVVGDVLNVCRTCYALVPTTYAGEHRAYHRSVETHNEDDYDG